MIRAYPGRPSVRVGDWLRAEHRPDGEGIHVAAMGMFRHGGTV